MVVFSAELRASQNRDYETCCGYEVLVVENPDNYWEDCLRISTQSAAGVPRWGGVNV